MIIRASSWLLVCAILLFSVGGCATEASENEIVELTHADSMLANVLVDLHRLDSAIFAKVVAANVDQEPSSMDFSETVKRDSVLAAHGLTASEFELNISEQLKDPLRFQSVYNLAVDNAVRQ